jgi:hypothetical protein
METTQAIIENNFCTAWSSRPEEVNHRVVDYLAGESEEQLSIRQRVRQWLDKMRLFKAITQLYYRFGAVMLARTCSYPQLLMGRADGVLVGARSIGVLMGFADEEIMMTVAYDQLIRYHNHVAQLVAQHGGVFDALSVGHAARAIARGVGHQLTSASISIPVPRHAVTSSIIKQARTQKRANQIVRTMALQRVVIMALKAELFSRILLGRLVYAADYYTTQDHLQQMYARQELLFIAIGRRVWSLVAFLGGIVDWLVGSLEVVGRQVAISNRGPEVQALLELGCACVAGALFGCLVLALVRLSRQERVLAHTVATGPPRYVARRTTENGVIHEIVINGILHVLADCDRSIKSEDEMALPGSTLFPSAERSVGAILVANDADELVVLGVFFRVGDYLVTAAHVANAVGAGVAKVFLAGTKNFKKNLLEVNLGQLVEMQRSEFALDESAVQTDYDIYVRKLSKTTWARLQIGVSSTKKDSCYNQTVSAVGFVGNLFMTSSGKTLAGSGPEELWHTASTQKGFSGSPLYSGNSVVGMHLSHRGDKNVALRIEIILMLLRDEPESNQADREDRRPQFKLKGRAHKVKELLFGDFYGFYDSQGRVDVGWTREQVQELMRGYLTGNPAHAHVEDLLDPDTTPLSDNSYRTFMQFAECADLPAPTKPAPQQEDVPRVQGVELTPKEKSPPELPEGVTRLPGKPRVHCNRSPAEAPEAAAYIDAKMDALVGLGFDSKKYQYPEITPDSERVSVVKHLELYHQRVTSVTKPPTAAEIKTAVRIITEMMSANAYEPDLDWKSTEAVLRVIDSSAIKASKSPGHPYQSAGHATIEQVLKAYTKEGFAELVVREWDSTDVELKAFIKPEPTKEEKLQREMPRPVTGMPLHKTVKNNCVFASFADSLVVNWKESPVKYAFNPQRPGDIAHLAEAFKGRQVVESDKSNWDYNFFPYLFDIACQVTQELAVRPHGMSEDSFQEYLSDVQGCYNEVTKHAVYRCTDGTVLKSQHEGIMKSGWFMTIAANSIGQLALHVLAMLRLGHSAEQIMHADYSIIVGGDDVLQTVPPGFSTDKYRGELVALGFDVSDFKVLAKFDGCEFFSNTFKIAEGVWTYHPTRFTKHVAHLRVTKLADLASALSSHMLNHVWDNKKFDFFEGMFRALRKEHPDAFPLTYLKSRRRLQYKVLGLEAA